MNGRATCLQMFRFFVVVSLLACVDYYVGTWTPPCPWTGPHPVRYWSFNTLDGLTLMEATVQRNFNALITGRVKKKTCLESNVAHGTPLHFVRKN